VLVNYGWIAIRLYKGQLRPTFPCEVLYCMEGEREHGDSLVVAFFVFGLFFAGFSYSDM